jgi:anthranilate phosphoribosyltransferase
MPFASFIKAIAYGEGDAGELSIEDARQLFGALLDGGVPDLEVGALLVALRIKGESLTELLGFHQAVGERVYRLRPPDGAVRPVVLASYGGAREQPNLTPLVALLLRRMGVPVLIHGGLEGYGRIASAYIFRALGVLPCATLPQAQATLDREKLAFVPTGVLCPGLANLLALRGRLGVRSSAHLMAKLFDPFAGASLRLVSATHLPSLARLRELLIATGESALLMRATEGEPYANPRQRPRMEYLQDGRIELLFEQEHGALECADHGESVEARATASYIGKILEGLLPTPLAIVNQLACCLYACGFTDDYNDVKDSNHAKDFNHAKALAAVQTHGRAAA